MAFQADPCGMVQAQEIYPLCSRLPFVYLKRTQRGMHTHTHIYINIHIKCTFITCILNTYVRSYTHDNTQTQMVFITCVYI